MQTQYLEFFELLYRLKSVSAAADMLELSQPTVSIWLSKLRYDFNDPLFVRTSEGMQPTPKADALIVTVREVLSGMKRLTSVSTEFTPKDSIREFRIFMSDGSHFTLLPQLFAKVHEIAPRIKLEAMPMQAKMAEALQEGIADLALGYVTGLEAGFYQQSLYPQDWICLTNAHHPRLKTKTFTLKQYASEAHIAIEPGTGKALIEAALKKSKTQRQVLLRIPGFLGLSAILNASDLIATVPRHIGETLAKNAGLKILPCPLAIEGFTVKQYWHTRYHHDAASKWLRGVIAGEFLAMSASGRSH